jgi:hypothetical protein
MLNTSMAGGRLQKISVVFDMGPVVFYAGLF